MEKEKISSAKLKEFLRYDPETGVFIWIKKRSKSRLNVGCEAGYKNVRGKICICFFGSQYYSHRLAWFYMKGYWPDQIDHINHDTSDNRIKNLRECKAVENMANRRQSKKSTTGYKGVSAYGNRFKSTIRFGYHTIHLGLFSNKEQAKSVYNEAAKILHGEFAYLN